MLLFKCSLGVAGTFTGPGIVESCQSLNQFTVVSLSHLLLGLEDSYLLLLPQALFTYEFKDLEDWFVSFKCLLIKKGNEERQLFGAFFT